MSAALAGPGSHTVTLGARLPDLPAQLGVVGPVEEGGEALVYFSSDGKYAVKVYKRANPDKAGLLEQVMRLGQGLGAEARFLAWPLGIVSAFAGDPAVGCVTRRISSTFVPLVNLILSPVAAVAQFREGRTWAQYLRLAREIAAAVRLLHDKGCAHADIHFRNFLADPSTGQAVLLDLDGLVVGGFLPPQVKGMLGFMAPEVVTGSKEPGELTDRHSAAILILHSRLLRNSLQPLLCYDPVDPAKDEQLGWGSKAVFAEHPSDRRHRPPNLGKPLYDGGALSYRLLPPIIQRLTERALIDGLHDPAQRPRMQEWEEGLAETSDHLVDCKYCRQIYPYPFWIQLRAARRCPFCGREPQAPFPVLFELLDPTAPGLYELARHLVLTPGARLYRDALEPRSLPPLALERRVPVGHLEWSQQAQRMLLVNDDACEWSTIVSGGRLLRVPPGQPLPLEPGMQIRFGAGRRLGKVVES